MKLPFTLSFIVPGISKCGTTTLCAMLAGHPQIFIPNVKEPNYFAMPADNRDHEHYIGLFSNAGPRQVIGEGSQLYSAHEFETMARDRIVAHNPDIKFIFMVRHPLERIESSFRELHHSGPNYVLNAPYTIKEAIDQFPALIQDTLYWQRINCYRQLFSDDNIMVIFLEDLKDDPHAIIKKCCEFLGVDAAFTNTVHNIKLNTGKEKLYDSQLLRAMRLNPHIGFKIARIPIQWQNRIFRGLGLRRPFRQPLQWDPATKASVIRQLQSDVENILAYGCKPADFWPDFNSPPIK
jgi:hypothetical protein